MIKDKFRNTKSKYRNKFTEVDGIKFRSKAEAECYSFLKLLERSGTIKLISLQPRVFMTAARILYIPDFLIDEGGKRVYIDVKGKQTRDFILKFKLWRYYGDGTLRLVKKNGFGFDKVKEITTTAVVCRRGNDAEFRSSL